MKFLKKAKKLFKKEEKFLTIPISQQKFEVIKPQEKKEEPKKQLIRSRETDSYVQLLVKKSQTPEKTIPYCGNLPDRKDIQAIINQLKDDAIKKQKKK